MTKLQATIALTFPDCVNRGEGPCEAWRGLTADYKAGCAKMDSLRQLAAKVIEWDDARLRFVDHGFMGDAHEADRLGVEIVADAKALLDREEHGK